MDFTYAQIIDAYTNALLPFASEINIEKSIPEKQQIETLSATLNSISAVNEIIPVDILRVNKFEIYSNMDYNRAGLYSIGRGNIQLLSKSDNEKSSPSTVGISIAHEYGHYIYDSIIKGDNPELHKKLESLMQDIAETFFNKDEEFIEKNKNKPCKSGNKNHKTVFDYISEPTEMFARAFSGIALKDMEASYKNGTCYGYNFKAEELEKFSDKFLDLCENFKESILENNSETRFELFSNLDDKEEAIIYKTEGALLQNAEIKHMGLNYKSKHYMGEMILRSKTTKAMSKNFSKTKKEVLKYDPKKDYIQKSTYSEYVQKFSSMGLSQVYARDSQIESELKAAKSKYNQYELEIQELEQTIQNDPTNYKAQRRLKVAEALRNEQHLEIDTLHTENIALFRSDIKNSPEYKRYSSLKRKETAINNFLNKFDVTSEGKFYSPIENMKIVQKLKNSIVAKLDSKVSDIVDEINYYDNIDAEKDKFYSKSSFGGIKPAFVNNYNKMEFSKQAYNEFVNELPEDHQFLIYHKNRYDECYEKRISYLKKYRNFDSKLKNNVAKVYENKFLKADNDIDKDNLTISEQFDILIKEASTKQDGVESSLLSSEANAQLNEALRKAYEKEKEKENTSPKQEKQFEYSEDFEL